MDALALINKYYPVDSAIRRMLLIHSWQVANLSMIIAQRHTSLNIDKELLLNGALVHDIGIFLTNAPSIHCYGSAPYILHGFYGGKLLRKEGLPELARFCERHTGAGLSREDIQRQRLPLPDEDFLPETLEEKIVCYADKFYSKSSLYKVKTFERIRVSLLKFGEEGADRFTQWHRQFEVEIEL